MRRDLTHYWRMSLAVTAGAAVASAVLTGALIVGDSVRGSLKDLTLERLGGVDHAVAGQRFLPEGVAERMSRDPAFSDSFRDIAPAILLQASAEHAEKKTRASQVGLQGVDQRFVQLFTGSTGNPLFLEEAGGIFPPVVINQGLAQTLGAAEGDQILVSLRRFTQVPSGSLLSRDDTANVVETVRLQVQSIIPDRQLGAFGLSVHQSTSYNAFVPLAALQKALDQPDAVNALVVASEEKASATAIAKAAVAKSQAESLDNLLRSHLSPDELGLQVALRDGFLNVESAEFIIKRSVDRALRAEASEHQADVLPVLTYLANALRKADHEVPYSTVAALPIQDAGSFGDLRLLDGSAAPALDADSILLNAWTAEQLQAEVGDSVTLEYFVVGPREDLFEESRSFTVRGILAMDGLAADSTLTQEYPGIAGSTNMSDWDPPFPVKLSKIRATDEDYWDDYRGTPKAFVNLETGRAMWQNRWGDLTSMRIANPSVGNPESFSSSFTQGVVNRLPTAAFGLTFQPVKALGLGASGGATDFGGLFIGLSQFVIVSAALLVSLLFGLATEQRAREIGLRLAVGFRPKQVRSMLLRQGGFLAAIGAMVGLAGAIGYAYLMMLGLRTWWLPAVGTSRLNLHVTPTALIGGYLGSMVVVLLTIFLTVRKVGRTPTPQLLRGAVADRASRTGKAARLTAVVTLGIAFAALAYAFVADKLDSPAIFGVVGPCLLVGLLAFFAVWIDRPQTGALSRPGFGAYVRMAVVNSRRNRGRSLLSTTLVAFAAFLIVTVAAYQEDFSDIEATLDSGTGGYHLVAQADVPLQQDLGDADGRFELGLPDSAEAELADAKIMPFRFLPGDDTSCLNLYQPEQPRILGVPTAQIERGGFTFQQTSEDRDNPWELLDLELEEGVIPVIGDFNSTQWILKLSLGNDLPLENERGETIQLRLVANLKTSVFQSELLMSEKNFLEHFPNRGGFPYFLIEAPDGKAQKVLETLESGLSRYGFDAVGTGEKLESFHAVQNTYLSTFRSLGGLGLLLGTLGLAVVLIRNVTERRRELAALRAFGFQKSTLRLLILIENLTLLMVGLCIGTVAALATAGSHVLHQASAVPWGPIVATLATIFLVGWLACWLAARGALKAELLPALKAET